jgi:hypothetical protein
VCFRYEEWTLQFFRVGVQAILSLIPILIVALLICGLMLKYTHSSTNVLTLFRLIFTLFLTCFIVTGTGISYVDSRDHQDPIQTMSLWHSCTNLTIIFVAVSSHRLVHVVPTDNVLCAKWSQVFVALYCLITCGRLLYNICHYFHFKVLERWIREQFKTPGRPGWKARLIIAAFIIVFDFVTSLCAVA